jgi:hypothetical protein
MRKNRFKVLGWPQNHHNKPKLMTILLVVISLNIANAAKSTKELPVSKKNDDRKNEVVFTIQKSLI